MRHLFLINNQVVTPEEIKSLKDSGRISYKWYYTDNGINIYKDVKLDGEDIDLREFFIENNKIVPAGYYYDEEDLSYLPIPKYLQDILDEYYKIPSVEEIENKIKNLEKGNYYGDSKLESLEGYFNRILRRRIIHCSYELEANLKRAKIDGSCVFWKGGHFQFELYKMLLKAYCHNPENWDAIIWQQIVRQMYLSNERNDKAFMYATEKMITV